MSEQASKAINSGENPSISGQNASTPGQNASTPNQNASTSSQNSSSSDQTASNSNQLAPISARIYVGNIDYSATEEELMQFYSTYKVQSVEIPSKTITRGSKVYKRRLGFGFVQFDSEKDAEKAIELSNGKKFKLRQIYAKKAVPPSTEEEKREKLEAFEAKKKLLKEQRAQLKKEKKATESKTKDSEPKTKTKSEPKAAAAAAVTEATTAATAPATTTAPAAAAAAAAAATATATATTPTQAELVKGAESTDVVDKPKKKSRAPKKAKDTTNVESSNGNGKVAEENVIPKKSAVESKGAAAEKKHRGTARSPGGDKSKRTVFITNLHHTVNSKALSELFQSLEPVWVHVPKRTVSPHILKQVRARRTALYNRGIAFVKFPSEEAQLAAIDQFNGHELLGKKIVLEIAIDETKPLVKDQVKRTASKPSTSPSDGA